MRDSAYRLAAIVLGLAATAPARSQAETTTADLLHAGRQIYEAGVLTSGRPLVGKRQGMKDVVGASAACILCHRRSGYGMTEGANVVPPIAAPSLFQNHRLAGSMPRRAKGISVDEPAFKKRPAYDDTSLALAIRQGTGAGGKPLQFLMPRYALEDADMLAVTAYLRTLSITPSPGLDANTIHFATVVDGRQSDQRKQAVADVLEACFAERFPQGRGAGRSWRLHLWTLDGDPAGWDAKLAARLSERPVFALVGGLGGADWEPVHRFCERERLPCLFPHVDVPGDPSAGHYTFYFSQGVVLEARVAARYIMSEAGRAGISRVVQIVGRSGAATTAAAAFRSAMGAAAIVVEDQAMSALAQDGFNTLGAGDAIVAWLDEDEIAHLSRRPPPAAGLLIFSGWLGGLENAPLASSWRAGAHLIYPFDAPPRWNVRMNRNLRPWLAGKGLSGGDERLKGNTLAACNVLAEGMAGTRGTLQRDHLVELVESYPAGMGNAPAPQAYPRFSLGPGQRISSKGAYIVRFAAPDFTGLEPVGDWRVP